MPVEFAQLGNSSRRLSGDRTGASPPPPPKKKRGLPGVPDPDAEVIALSPKSLMATNRFVCEICSKGFQRDQNLQLHRRGHNLPWNLRQRSGKEVRRRVYVCPEPSCVHHDASRALGDLTGIKKHFCRKHGEKNWKCDKCSKKYAVQSDWKAHSKTCGTKEYKCDCGTLFSRRDSFVTHRAFCDAFAGESAEAQTASEEDRKLRVATDGAASSSPSLTAVFPIEQPEPDEQIFTQMPTPQNTIRSTTNTTNSNGSIFASLFASTSCNVQPQSSGFSDLLGAMPPTPPLAEPTSLCLSSHGSNIFMPGDAHDRSQFVAPTTPHMSATALLQKAAQMGPAATSESLLQGFGLSMSASSSALRQRESLNSLWHLQEPLETAELNAGLPGVMTSNSSMFGSELATLDLLGLGGGAGWSYGL